MDKCFFCDNLGGKVLLQSKLYRIILIDDGSYPGYLRVVLNEHKKELTDLSDEQNLAIYQAVLRCEKIIRQIFMPDKINLASFGNLTPHVHWHIIPRFKDDKHFPNPIWGQVTNFEYQPSGKLYAFNEKLIKDFEQLFTA